MAREPRIKSRKFRGVHGDGNIRARPALVRGEVLLKDARAQGNRAQAGVIAEGMVAEADDGIGEGVREIRERAEADLIVGRGVHGRAVQQGEWHACLAENFDSRGDAGQVVHAGAQNHGLAVAWRCGR